MVRRSYQFIIYWQHFPRGKRRHLDYSEVDVMVLRPMGVTCSTKGVKFHPTSMHGWGIGPQQTVNFTKFGVQTPRRDVFLARF